MSDDAHNWTDKELKRMERHLTEIYSRANKDLQEKADKYFQRFKELDEQKRALVESGKMSERDYKTWRQNKIMTGKHWTAMKEQVAQELANVDKTALDYVNGRLPEVYAVNYNAVGDAIESKVKGYSFELVDASTVKRLATADRKLLPYKELDIAKDKRWNMRMFQSEVLQGVIQGESMGKIANRIFPEIMSKTDLTGKSAAEIKGLTKRARDAAFRNARTMVTGAENMGRLDMLRNAQDKGVIAHKIWMATPDNRTRDSHRHIDGEEVESDKEFSNGLQCPGDPDGDPAEVYNCRCTLGYKVVGFGTESIENNTNETNEQENKRLEPVGSIAKGEPKQAIMQKPQQEKAGTLTNEKIDKMSRSQLERAAKKVYIASGGHMGYTEEEAKKVFDKLISGNSTTYLRKYIKKHRKLL